MRFSDVPELLPELPHRLFSHWAGRTVHAGALGTDLPLGSALDAEAVAAQHRLQPQGQVPVHHASRATVVSKRMASASVSENPSSQSSPGRSTSHESSSLNFLRRM